MGKKKKVAGPPPIFNTSSAPSKKEREAAAEAAKLEAEAKAVGDANDDSQTSVQAAKANSSEFNPPTRDSKGIVTEDSKGGDKKSSKNKKSRPEQQEVSMWGDDDTTKDQGKNETKAQQRRRELEEKKAARREETEIPKTWAALIAQKEKEEAGKLGIKGVGMTGNQGSKGSKGDGLKTAGVIQLSPELEEKIFKTIRKGCSIANGNVVEGDTSKSDSKPDKPEEDTITDKDTITIAITDTTTITDTSTSIADTPDPIACSFYLPDAYRVRSTAKMTYDRLNAIFVDLQELGFSDKEIERAMRHTYGYDGRAALEYLVLTAEEDQLPPLFQSEASQARAAQERKAKLLEMEKKRIEEEERRKKEEKEREERAKEEKKKREAELKKKAEEQALLEEEKKKSQPAGCVNSWILDNYGGEEPSSDEDGGDKKIRGEDNYKQNNVKHASEGKNVSKLKPSTYVPGFGAFASPENDSFGSLSKGTKPTKGMKNVKNTFSYDSFSYDAMSPTNNSKTNNSSSNNDPSSCVSASDPVYMHAVSRLIEAGSGSTLTRYSVLTLFIDLVLQPRARELKEKMKKLAARQADVSSIIAQQKEVTTEMRAWQQARDQIRAKALSTADSTGQEMDSILEDEKMKFDAIMNIGAAKSSSASDTAKSTNNSLSFPNESKQNDDDDDEHAPDLFGDDIPDNDEDDLLSNIDDDEEEDSDNDEEDANDETKDNETENDTTTSNTATAPPASAKIPNAGGTRDPNASQKVQPKAKSKKKAFKLKAKPAEKLPVKDNLKIPGSWTGQLPSQILDDWVGRTLGKQYNTRKSCDRQGIGRVVVLTNGGSTTVADLSPPFRCKSKKDAIELASTYILWKMQNVGTDVGADRGDNKELEVEVPGTALIDGLASTLRVQLGSLAHQDSSQELLPLAYKACYNAWELEREEQRVLALRARVGRRVRLCLELSEEYEELRMAALTEKHGMTEATEEHSTKATEAQSMMNLSMADKAAKRKMINFSLSKPAKKDSAVETVQKDNVDGDENDQVNDEANPNDENVDNDETDDKKKPSIKELSCGDHMTVSRKRLSDDAELRLRFVQNEKRKDFMEQRENLPVGASRDEIVNMINESRISVVSGSTGSGKTTQVPQFVLEHSLLMSGDDISIDNGNGGGDLNHSVLMLSQLPQIIVTEPRRISAMSVAQRVADEMGDSGVGQNLVGYQIRLEKRAHPRWCRLLFCTTGVLLQRLKSDPLLNGVTHVFVDEVHERSAESDLALLLLKRNLKWNNLRLCLMSATADEDKLLEYFNDVGLDFERIQTEKRMARQLMMDEKKQRDEEKEKIENMRKEAMREAGGSANAGTTTKGKDDNGSDSDEDFDAASDGSDIGESSPTRGDGSDIDDSDPTDGSGIRKFNDPSHPSNRNNPSFRPSHIAVPGRIFPVEEHYLEDVIEASGFQLDMDDDFAKSAVWKDRIGANQSVITVKQTGGGSTTHISIWDADETDFGNQDEIELPYKPMDFARQTLDTLWRMDHNRINYDLIEATMELIEREYTSATDLPRHQGSVLIFLPGMPEISRCHSVLAQNRVFGDPSQTRLVLLHSALTTKDQQGAFSAPPRGIRKIVLATNIAETGVTIPDVVFVIDTGKVKQQRYHEPSNTSTLKEVFVSQAEAVQRRGRAGRVRSGFCFRLYTKKRFDKKFLPAPVPELLRCSLTELMLSVLIAGFQPAIFNEALDVPPTSRIAHAVNLLKDVGCCSVATGSAEIAALRARQYGKEGVGVGNKAEGQMGISLKDKEGGNKAKQKDATNTATVFNPLTQTSTGGASSSVFYAITPLGRALARLPTDIRLGKMLLLAQLFGGSDYVFTVAACLANAKSVFLEPFQDAQRQLAKTKQGVFFQRIQQKSASVVLSDHLAAAEAVKDFEALGVGTDTQKGDAQPAQAGQPPSKLRVKESKLEQRKLCDGFWLNQQAVQQVMDIKEDFCYRLNQEFPQPQKLLAKDRPTLAAAVIGSGLRPNVARYDRIGQDSYHNVEWLTSHPGSSGGGGKDSGQLVISSGADTAMSLHKGSSFVRLNTTPAAFRWISYYAKLKTGARDAAIRDCTVLSNPAWVALLHNEDWDLIPTRRAVVFNGHRGGLGDGGGGGGGGGFGGQNSVRDWQCFAVSPRAAIVLRQLKLRFQAVFRHWILANVGEAATGAKKGERNNVGDRSKQVLSKDACEILDLMRRVLESRFFLDEAR